jgi:hypothetical protein
MKFSDLNLGEIDSDQILTDTTHAGAFISFGDNIGAVPAAGFVIPTLTGIVATGLGEGKKKLSSGKIETLVMRPNKVQASVVATEEMIAAKTQIVKAIWEKFPSAEVKLVENVILGTTPKPVDWSGISTFADNVPMTIAAGVEGKVDLDDAIAGTKDSVTNFAVLSTAMEAYLQRQYIGSTGQPAHLFTKDNGTKYLNGIEYKTIVSTTARGVFGDRDRLFVSLTSFPSPITGEEYRVKDSGTWEDQDGTVHNLNDNKIALVHESMAAAGFNPLDFTVIVPAPAA